MKMDKIDFYSIECVEELEKNGTQVIGKNSLMERLVEVQNWKVALKTLIHHGARIHTTLIGTPNIYEKNYNTLLKYGFNPKQAEDCAKAICSH